MIRRNLRIVAGAGALAVLGAGASLATRPDPVADDTGGIVVQALTPEGPSSPTHGNDALSPPPQDAPRLAREVAWPCEGDGQDGKRVQWIYAHAAGQGNLATLRPTLESYARRVQGMFQATAESQGGSRLVRYVTEPDCSLSILDVTLSQGGVDSFSGFQRDLERAGLDSPDRKYSAWVESNTYCGIGTLYGDDRPGAENYNNVFNGQARSDRGCWGSHTEAHELLHMLGAVQDSAPNSTLAGHCNDESDPECYDDGGPRSDMRQVCPRAHEDQLDCGKNDYFSLAPPAGSYLATHWNVASSSYLNAGSPPTTTPPPTTLPPPTTVPPPTTSTTKVGGGATRTTQVLPDRVRVGQQFAWEARIVGRVPACAGIGDGGFVDFFLSGEFVERVPAIAGTATLLTTIDVRDRYYFRVRYVGNGDCKQSSDSDRKRVS